MLDKAKVSEFRGDFANAVAQLEKQYGMNITLGTISFNSNELKAKMTATVGNKVIQPSKGDFRVGDVVWIDHKKVQKDDRFSVIKINGKNIKVEKITDEGFGAPSLYSPLGATMTVSPGLLRIA